QLPQAGRRDHTVRLDSPVPVCKQRVAVGIDEIGRPEPAHVGGKTFYDGKSVIERWLHATAPQFRKTLKQDAKCDFRIRLTDRPKAMPPPGMAIFDMVKTTVVGKHVQPAAQFADERLGVCQRNSAARGVPNVRQNQSTCEAASSDKTQPSALARGFRL